jgi:hypothetical protein
MSFSSSPSLDVSRHGIGTERHDGDVRGDGVLEEDLHGFDAADARQIIELIGICFLLPFDFTAFRPSPLRSDCTRPTGRPGIEGFGKAHSLESCPKYIPWSTISNLLPVVSPRFCNIIRLSKTFYDHDTRAILR